LKPFNNGGELMAKKALSTLSLQQGKAAWKNSASEATLALSWVWSHVCLEEPTQQTMASTNLVRTLDDRGLYF
jgi:hypothetical protein